MAPQGLQSLLAVADHVDRMAPLCQEELQEILGDLTVLRDQDAQSMNTLDRNIG